MLRIQKTQDYNQFKRFPGNRPVTEHFLVDSIKKKNLLESRPITVNKDLYVIDGQHRLAAARILNVPIYYVVDERLTEDDIAIFNSNQKSWTPTNYLNLYAERQLPAYVFVNNIVKEFKLPIHFVITCLDRSKNCYDNFNEGKIIINNEEQMHEALRQFSEVYESCKEACSAQLYITNHAMRTLWTFMSHKNYVHDEFFDKCKKFPDKVIRCFIFREAANVKKELSNLFNYKRTANHRVTFN